MIKNSLFFVFTMIIVSCSPDKYMKNDSGLVVEYLTHGEGSYPKNDSILIIYMKQRNIKDKVIHHSYPMRPMALRFNSTDSAGHLWEVMSKMKIGDSVYFNTTAKNLYEETYKRRIPNIFIPESTIKINLKIADQLTEEAYETFDKQMIKKIDSMKSRAEILKMEGLLMKDGETIDAFLNEKGISAVTTNSGLRYLVKEKGTGPKVAPGDLISINYTGGILNGDTFDSSTDLGEPFEFTIGIGSVIAGWDEGFAYLRKGDKAKFYVPSPLAYGSARPNANIPSNAIMVFDVEVVDVKKK